MSRIARLRAVLVASAATVALVLGACAAPQSSSSDADSPPVHGGNLNYQLASDPQTLDLVASVNAVNSMVSWNIYGHLFERDRTMEPKPGLVDTWSKSADGLTYMGTLMKGVTFHDGTPLTTKDVVASLNRWLQRSHGGQLAAPSVVGITALDDLKFEIKLSKRRYNLEGELAVSGTEIHKASVLDGIGQNGVPRDKIIGTGPYELESWGPKQLVLRRFDNFVSRSEDWGGNAGVKHRYVDTITFHFVGDDNAIMSGLQAGRWDIARPSPDQVSVIESDPKLAIDYLPGANINTLVFNRNPQAAFSDIRARQGLNLAVNKQELIAASGGERGIVVPESSFFPKDRTNLYSAAGREVYDQFDPERAKALFAEAGVRPGRPIRIVTTQTFPQNYQWAVLVQDQLKRIGIESEIRTYDYVSLLGYLSEQPTGWDLTMALHTGNLYPGPATMAMVGPPWLVEQGPQLRSLLASYLDANDPARARTAVDAIQAYFWQELTQIVFGHTRVWTARSSRVNGVIADGTLSNVWLASP